MTTQETEKELDIEIREIPKRKKGRPTLQEDRGVTPEAVLNAYWTIRSIRRTAKALQISTTSVKKYLKLAGNPEKAHVKYRQPYPWFRKGTGPVWKWISENREVVANVRNLEKLANISGIAPESLKKALTRRKGIAILYLETHGKIQDSRMNVKVMDLTGVWRPVKYIEHYQIDLDRYSMGVRFKMLFQVGVTAVTIMTYQEALELFQVTTGKKIELPKESVLVKTVGDFFPVLDESTLVLTAASVVPRT